MTHQIPCFEFEAVSFAWPGGRNILDRQSFCLPSGGFALVRGSSGAGKSTLLRLMNRLEEADAGVIRYRGSSLTDHEPPRLRQEVAYLQQTPVIPDRTVREILLHPFEFRVNREIPQPADAALRDMLDRVCMETVGLDEPGAALSGGQRQRLGLLRTLVTGPRVLLLDEPTASLDDESKTGVRQMAETVCREGTTVVMITHDGFVPAKLPVLEITISGGEVTVCN